MRKYIIIFLLLIVSLFTKAALHSINNDVLTVSAMGAAYEKHGAVELETSTAIDSIFRHYGSSTISMSEIMATKLMEHKALKDVGLFTDEEFMYYTQIRKLLTDQITPNLINVSYQFIQHPDNILYWGPYLYKTTNRVQSLCMTFESMVSNGKLSFKDIKFLIINEKFKQYFDLLKMGKDFDFKGFFEKLGDFGKGLTWENIKDDFNHLGTTIANIGAGAFDKGLEDATTIGKVFKSSPAEIIKMYKQFKGIYNTYKDVRDAKSLATSLLDASDPNWIDKLFDTSDYNISNYMSSYIKELQGTYYTQIYYIKRTDEGKKVIAQFTPKKGTPDALYSKKKAPAGWGNEWIKNAGYNYRGYGPKNQSEIDGDKDYPHVKKSNSEILDYVRSYSGYDQAFVDNYKSSHPGNHSISIESTLCHEDRVNYLGHPGNHNRNDRYCYKSYAFTITDSWSNDSIVYEEMFDSKTMDLETFMKNLERRVKGYEDLQSDSVDERFSNPYKYTIISDPKREYTEASQATVKNKASVTFIAHCGTGQDLGSGSFSWKVNSKKQKGSLTDYSIELAMGASDQSSDKDIKSLEEKEKQLRSEIEDFKKQETELDDQMSTLSKKIMQYSVSGNTAMVKQLQQQYNALSSQKDDVVSRRESDEAELQANTEAIGQYYEDMMYSSDDSPLRINTCMQQYQAIYQILWNDDAAWQKGESEYTYTRTGYSRSGKFQVTYTAKLTLQRKPQYFLGIRIHRPILQVEYELTSSQSSSSVLETMQLDPDMSDKDKADKINDRLEVLKQDYPNCSIELDYQEAKNVVDEEDEDKIHLLLPSTRLEIARTVYDQLMQINGELLTINHMIQYRKTIKQWFVDILLDLTDRGARGDIANVAFANWKAAARQAKQKQNSNSGQSNNNKDPASQKSEAK